MTTLERDSAEEHRILSYKYYMYLNKQEWQMRDREIELKKIELLLLMSEYPQGLNCKIHVLQISKHN